MDWTLIETDSDLLCGDRVKRHHVVKLIRLEIWAGWFRNNGCYWLTTPHPSPSPPLGWVEGWTPLQPLAPSGATALRARSQLMWSHGFLQAPALSRPLSGPTLGAPESAREDNQRSCFGEVCCYVSKCPVHCLFSSLWLRLMIWIICKRPVDLEDPEQLQKHRLSRPSSSSRLAHLDNKTGLQKSCPNFRSDLQMKFHIGPSSL